MVPPQGPQLELTAWSWAEETCPEDVGDEHVALAYRVRMPACRRSVCKSNCPGNPNCLVGVGERLWLGDEADDPELERRAEGAFVGLTNLGATCYVNAFLQVWFNNLELRRSLYLCRGAADGEDAVEVDATYEPRSIWEHLQYLFALLQGSRRRCVDPSGLLGALGLDTRLQQDAQEFSKLFLTLLEDSLAKQADPALRRAIQRQFCGELAYVTECGACGRVSPRPSAFYELELPIQGLRSLAECLGELLREERLDGDNRYFCEGCGGKQDAVRCLRLAGARLPPVLNLQLMRFVFDRETGLKKKLSSYISFPERLDMAPFVVDGGGDGNGEADKRRSCLYELSTVLVHRGPTAYSGHYLAHVKDECTGDWHTFNDEDIECSRALHLGAEEDPAAPPYAQPRKPRCASGHHASRNAYMLVYRKVLEEEDDTRAEAPEVPAFLQRLVDRNNHAFEARCAEAADRRNKTMAQWKEIRELYEMLPACPDVDDQPYEFLPLKWLKAWLGALAAARRVPEIDNTPFLCPHGGLDPTKVCDAKRVSSAAATRLYERYGGGALRLDAPRALCRHCVAQHCHVRRSRMQLRDDFRRVSELCKGPTGGEGFYVGKESLKTWDTLVLKRLGEEDEREAKKQQCGIKDDLLPFNEDIRCIHGALSTLSSDRKAVPAEAWAILRRYFPEAPEFPQQGPPAVCQLCVQANQEERSRANAQRSQLSSLFKEKGRPSLLQWQRNTDVLYMVPQPFVDEWRKFVQRPNKSAPLSRLDNGILLCPHGGFYLFNPKSLAMGDVSIETKRDVALLFPAEWEVVRRLFRVEQAVSVHRSPPSFRGGPPVFTTQPGVCWECRAGYVAQRQRDMREYVAATITIRKEKMIRPEEEEEEEREEEPGTSTAAEHSSGSDGVDEGEDADESPRREAMEVDGVSGPDPRVTVNNNNKKKKSNNQTSVRRTQKNKNRKRPEEKRITVSAAQTLRDLKIQIVREFTVMPMDQHLTTAEGRLLLDNDATLGSLGLTPGCVVILRVDEPIADFATMYDVHQLSVPEAGFKGTGLLGY